MTVTIELKPEIEARVKTEAAVLGMPVEDYLKFVIESQLGNVRREPYSENRTPEERARAWEAWAAGHSLILPLF